MVTGSKRVRLMHPDLTPCVYPLPLWGQSSNHSAVDFAQPDALEHPRFQQALQAQQSFEMQVRGSCMTQVRGLAQALAWVWLDLCGLPWLQLGFGAAGDFYGLKSVAGSTQPLSSIPAHWCA